MTEGSYTAICEAYDKLYKRLPTRRLIRASAALPMLMGENEDVGAEDAESVQEEHKDRDSSVRVCKRCGGRVLKDGKCDTCNSVIEPLVMESERERFSDSVRSNAERIFDFFRGNGVEIDPVPEIVVKFDSNDPFDPLIRTGCYDCDARTITLCCANRHLKDVLRTFCHELIHHNQNLLNPETFKRMNKEGKLRDNAELSDMEGDAYARGNVMFRKWTESL